MKSVDAQSNDNHSITSDELQLLRCEDYIVVVVQAEGETVLLLSLPVVNHLDRLKNNDNANPIKREELTGNLLRGRGLPREFPVDLIRNVERDPSIPALNKVTSPRFPERPPR